MSPMQLCPILRGMGGGTEGEGRCVSAGADTKRTLRSWFERQAAYLSDCSVELPLRPSASTAPPSGPMSWLCSRLRGWGSLVGGEPCQWALTRKPNMLTYGARAYLSVLTVWFLDKSSASSFASAASRPRFEKLMSVCSGWMPQRVMICGISETTDRMASAPSPSEFPSRLRLEMRSVNRR